MPRPIAASKPAQNEETGNSARKHRAILDAALNVFLRSGYLGENMDAAEGVHVFLAAYDKK